MAESYSIRASIEAHQALDKKLAQANITRTRKGKKVLRKSQAVAVMAAKLTVKDLVDA